MKSQSIGLITQTVLCGALVTFVGCRPKGAVPTAKPVEANVSQSIVGGDSPELPSLSQVTTLDAGDPNQEGWFTEAFTQDATKQLNRLGQCVVGELGIDDDTVAQLASDKFSCSRLIPEELHTVFRDELLVVQRGSNASAPRVTDGPLVKRFISAVQPLRSWLADLPQQRHFKFKLFRIVLDEDESDLATTRQYVQFSARSAGRACELNAEWLIDWERHDGRPLIRSIRLEQFEQVGLQAEQLFADCTRSVLRDNVSYERALLPGIPHWRKRFEQQLGVYNFGHHGLAVGDVNGDGLEDVYVCQTGGLPNHLFVQRRNGTVEDISAAAGVGYLDNTRSALFLDIDNDDDQDLVLALTTGLLLLENDGTGHFQVRARIPSVRQAFSLAAADYNQDGLLDLYICVYYGAGDSISELPVPVPYFDATNGGKNHLIRNEGNWRFTDATEQVGLDEDNRRFSFAAVWEDYDGDGDPDLVVVNDSGPNHLYQNTGGRFRNIANSAGLVDGAFGMSATFGDYDRDGHTDLYVSNMFSAAGNRVTFQPRFKPTTGAVTKARFQHLARGNSLFRGTADGRFQDVSVAQGVTMGRWSWGSLFADVNNDGWDDLLVSNGFVTGDSKDDL